jgi:hypothetical protein
MYCTISDIALNSLFGNVCSVEWRLRDNNFKSSETDEVPSVKTRHVHKQASQSSFTKLRVALYLSESVHYLKR